MLSFIVLKGDKDYIMFYECNQAPIALRQNILYCFTWPVSGENARPGGPKLLYSYMRNSKEAHKQKTYPNSGFRLWGPRPLNRLWRREAHGAPSRARSIFIGWRLCRRSFNFTFYLIFVSSLMFRWHNGRQLDVFVMYIFNVRCIIRFD
jgi:hypothetical protein